ncbi:hypothetical protein FACS18947_0960 [Bacteroidia bacterium]|nr:hypothetical protein FACS18947_0960 [Bacteroidia bacterium]
MKKSLMKGLILGAIFVVSIILFSNILNKDMTDHTVKLSGATFPMLYMQVEDTLVNPMYGYRQEMQNSYLRDGLTPISMTRDLTVAIQPFGNQIQALSYEVMTADGNAVVENGNLSGLREDGDLQKADFHLETPILMNQEYTLKFIVDIGAEKPLYYYTRLIQRVGLNVNQYLEFVRNFYEGCISKETAKGLTTYIEPDEMAAISTDFTKIDIHSSFEQLTWGSLHPSIFRKAVPVIKEINQTTCSVELNYEITAEDSDNNVEYYEVTEFYRMRYSGARVMLLDFSRDAGQIFDAELPVITSQGINLGVAPQSLQHVSNQNADIVAFVVAGDLWSYNRSANKATKIFSFREKESPDERTENEVHGIKIVRVEESGDMDFVLYGYMNRGTHEGEVGVGVYHYSVQRNVAVERIFIQETEGYDFLKEDVENLSFVNKQDQFYLYMGNQLYHIDLQQKTCKTILSDIRPSCFVASKTQKNVAWMNEMKENDSSAITIMNLESGQQKILQAKEGQRLKALGFINEDFIYGIAKTEDIVTDQSGNTTFAMRTVRIQNFAGEVIKEYQKSDSWVSEAALKGGLVELKQVRWDGERYVSTDSENIMNNLQTTAETVTIHLSVNERKGTQLALDFSKKADSKTLLYLEAKYEIPKEAIPIKIDETPLKNVYYVYARGVLDSVWMGPAAAIQRAEGQLGVVLDDNQQYIWERGNLQDKMQLKPEEIPEAVLTGTLDESALQTSLGDEMIVLNLTGCTLESVLYQVSMKRAVIARTPTGESVLIVGYDKFNTILYNPVTQQTYYYGMNDSTALFASAGNRFLGYIEKPKPVK